MTRINVIPPCYLTDQHLLAEVREIVRMPSYLNKSLNSKKGFKLSDIPTEYTMSTGHVKFFYNKFHWLKKRYEKLITECECRGFSIANTDSSIFKVGKPYYNGYIPTGKSFKINRERIIERIKANKDFYRHYGQKRNLITGDKVTYLGNDEKWVGGLVKGKTYIINYPYQDGYSLMHENLTPTGYWARESMLELNRVKDTRLARKMYPDFVEDNGWLYEI